MGGGGKIGGIGGMRGTGVCSGVRGGGGESDRGVLVFGDTRLLERPYGAVFIDSMPSMEITRRLADVEAFFRQAGVSA